MILSRSIFNDVLNIYINTYRLDGTDQICMINNMENTCVCFYVYLGLNYIILFIMIWFVVLYLPGSIVAT